jgi:DNA-binding response OmpR family regulator
LKLTEKEVDAILFLYKKKTPQNVKILLREVWGYLKDVETHTVETHIHRLRKKIKDHFNDENFIISHDEGYKI